MDKANKTNRKKKTKKSKVHQFITMDTIKESRVVFYGILKLTGGGEWEPNWKQWKDKIRNLLSKYRIKEEQLIGDGAYIDESLLRREDLLDMKVEIINILKTAKEERPLIVIICIDEKDAETAEFELSDLTSRYDIRVYNLQHVRRCGRAPLPPGQKGNYPKRRKKYVYKEE